MTASVIFNSDEDKVKDALRQAFGTNPKAKLVYQEQAQELVVLYLLTHLLQCLDYLTQSLKKYLLSNTE